MRENTAQCTFTSGMLDNLYNSVRWNICKPTTTTTITTETVTTTYKISKSVTNLCKCKNTIFHRLNSFFLLFMFLLMVVFHLKNFLHIFCLLLYYLSKKKNHFHQKNNFSRINWQFYLCIFMCVRVSVSMSFWNEFKVNHIHPLRILIFATFMLDFVFVVAAVAACFLLQWLNVGTILTWDMRSCHLVYIIYFQYSITNYCYFFIFKIQFYV